MRGDRRGERREAVGRPGGPVSARSVVRAGLILLGVLHVSWGLPAVLAPRWFFIHFPGLGHAWTAAYPPYNQHLMSDVGAAFLTLGALLLAAAWLADRRVSTVVLSGLLLFSGLHLAFHLVEHGGLTGVDLVASLTALALGVLLPGVLLVLTRRGRA